MRSHQLLEFLYPIDQEGTIHLFVLSSAYQEQGGGEVGKLLGDISVPIHTTHTAHKQTDTQTYKHTHTHTLPHILGRVLRELQL